MKLCYVCNGSGEGAYDRSVCPACRGLGEERHGIPVWEKEDWEYDRAIEERLAEEE